MPDDANLVPHAPPLPRPRVILAFAAVSVAVSVFVGLYSAAGLTDVYRLAAERIMHGRQIYVPGDTSAFVYPPFFALVYLPLAFLPLHVDRAVWCLVNLWLLGVIVWLTLAMVGPALPNAARARRLAYVLMAVLSARFLLSPMEYQSHALIVYMLATLTIYFWRRDANLSSGVAAGLAAACKATPLLFLPVFAWQGRFRAVAVATFVVVAATLLPDLLFPNPAGRLWCLSWFNTFVSKINVAAANDIPGAWDSWNHLNQSLSGTLYRLFTPIDKPTRLCWNVCLCDIGPGRLKLLSAILKLAILAALAVIAWPGHFKRLDRDGRAFLIVGQGSAVLLAMLLLSPMSSKYHFCVLFTPICFCVADWSGRRRDPILLATLILGFLLGTLGARDIVGLHIANQLAAYGSLTWYALALLATTGYIVIRRGREGGFT